MSDSVVLTLTNAIQKIMANITQLHRLMYAWDQELNAPAYRINMGPKPIVVITDAEYLMKACLRVHCAVFQIKLRPSPISD